MSQLVVAYLLGVLTTPLVSVIVLVLLDRATRAEVTDRLSARQMRSLSHLRRAVRRGEYEDDLVGETANR